MATWTSQRWGGGGGGKDTNVWRHGRHISRGGGGKTQTYGDMDDRSRGGKTQMYGDMDVTEVGGEGTYGDMDVTEAGGKKHKKTHGWR